MLYIAFECTNLSPILESLNKMAIMFMIKPWFDFRWAARVDCNKTYYFITVTKFTLYEINKLSI